ncbi:pyridoxamine 5'-phosphate oxidase family protein [Olleya sp. YS]|uniref:pyridoxamine 5'-phosphate oxidase family protein n=1 Tax=Olleya sp. YS TaxID=3028318 RepID=UPI0024341571|nr:pyridoxamine 5'-phosphate oxidase family protein [Olleya sp. YS]WGD34746.1 pyridoxamine 5'-phosphate oxidase family protein [Olleya sp. YS]
MFKNLEEKEIKYILENNYIGHMGYVYQNRPFVVPITFFYDQDIKAIICYSADGHKMHALRIKPDVCLQINTIDNVTNWKSVLVHGVFEQKFGSDAKSYLHKFSLGVKDIILGKEHKKASFIDEFSSKKHDDNIPAVFLIHIEEITGKKRNT